MHSKSSWRRARAALLAAFAAAALLASVFSPGLSSPAQANPSAGFNAGNIISDSLFYDGAAMGAGDIQAFLNQKVSRCTIGDPGREAYSPYGNTRISGACFKDSRWTTSARPADAYCRAMTGGSNETAASYIARVAVACGISPRVLLVMLEKEQSLVSDTWPTMRQYDFAMGAYCPDSGPGGSANCDPSRSGFPNQLYNGARLLKIYKAFPDSYRYRANQWNTIQWHPNTGCGTSQVWIANSATAALYIYTPYRPNQAALDAGWGTGDSCSSYGNRNFYNFYTSWFGSTQGYPVSPNLASFYNANGGATGVFGVATGAARLVGIGVTQEFASATLYWNPYTGSGSVNGAIRTLFNQKGGVWGYLGYPVGREGYAHGGSIQQFERGTAYWTSRTGASAINGAIRDLYNGAGGPGGYLGFPVGVESYPNGGARQEFERGTAYWSARTGAAAVNGAIRDLYHRNGGSGGYMGFPKGVEVHSGGFTRQEFDRATVYYTDGTGASAVNGAIRELYNRNNGPRGYMGLPVGVEVHTGGFTRQEFQKATVYYTDRTGASAVNGAIRELYNSTGGPRGYLGLPVGVEVHSGGFTRQEFEKGTIYYTDRTGASAINGAIRARYLETGGPSGVLGLPIGREVHSGGVTRQQFEKGTLFYTAARGVWMELTPKRSAAPLDADSLPDPADGSAAGPARPADPSVRAGAGADGTDADGTDADGRTAGEQPPAKPNGSEGEESSASTGGSAASG